jgi:hypothetical protein
MNLNIRYDLPKEIWKNIIPQIYNETPGFLGFASEEMGYRKNLPHWFSFNESEKHVYASVEPACLHFEAYMMSDEWDLWKREVKEIASKKIGFKVGEIELGEVGY